MKGYTSITKIQNYLLITVDESFHDQVEEWIGQIEAYIESFTGRVFILDEDDPDTEKIYDGDGTDSLLIDDAVSVTKIETGSEVDGWDEVDADDYLLYPANKAPKTKVLLKAGTFLRLPQSVKVTGKFAYSEAVPADLSFAATVLAAGIINYSLNAEGEVRSMTVGRYTVTYKDEKQWQDLDRAKETLGFYRKMTF